MPRRGSETLGAAATLQAQNSLQRAAHERARPKPRPALLRAVEIPCRTTGQPSIKTPRPQQARRSEEAKESVSPNCHLPVRPNRHGCGRCTGGGRYLCAHLRERPAALWQHYIR